MKKLNYYILGILLSVSILFVFFMQYTNKINTNISSITTDITSTVSDTTVENLITTAQTSPTEDSLIQTTQQVITAQTIKTPVIATDLLNTLIEDSNGDRTSFYHLLNKPTIINLWASWCPPCREEMPLFQSMYEQYGNEIDFLMINATASRESETPEAAKAFLEQLNYTFPIYYDVARNTQAKWGAHILPYTIIIEADGTTTHYPGQIAQEQLQVFIDTLLN